MQRITTLASCLLAALSVSAVLVAPATAALPEFVGPIPNPFKSTSKKTTLETIGKTKVTCAASTDTGELTGPQSGVVTISFSGCEALKFPCATPGVAGEIRTGTLTMTLGYVSRVPKEVGIDLSSPTGAPITTFICGNLTGTVEGSVIGVITPINKLTLPPRHFTLKFKQKKGKQQVIQLLGGSVDVLKTSLAGGPFEESGLASIDSLDFAAPLEVKA